MRFMVMVMATKESESAPPPKPDPRQEDKDEEPPVPLQKRAYPLIQLLQASTEKGTDVTWEEGVPIP